MSEFYDPSIVGGCSLAVPKSEVNVLAVPSNPYVLGVERISESARLPTKANFGDAGYDLYTSAGVSIFSGQPTEVSTGIIIAIPHGYFGLVCEKSGLAKERGLQVMGGVIDSGYRGEVKVLVRIQSGIDYIPAGSKIAQLVILPVPQMEVLETKLDRNTERGDRGFGSSGAY